MTELFKFPEDDYFMEVLLLFIKQCHHLESELDRGGSVFSGTKVCHSGHILEQVTAQWPSSDLINLSTLSAVNVPCMWQAAMFVGSPCKNI